MVARDHLLKDGSNKQSGRESVVQQQGDVYAWRAPPLTTQGDHHVL